MSAHSMTDREKALERTFASAFAALDSYAASSPAAADRVREFIAAHLRSSAPMILGAPPSIDPAAEIVRDLGDGASYELKALAGCVAMTITDGDGDRTVVAMTPVAAIRMRADIAAVAATIGVSHG